MTSWTVVELGSVCQIINGGTPKSEVAKYWGGDNQWITPKDMGKLQGKYVEETERQITAEGLQNCSAKLSPPKSVILSSRAPIGHLAINLQPMATNQGCKTLIPSPKIDYLYLYYFLAHSKQLLNDLGSGTTFKELSGTKLAAVPIPLPPLPVQKAIVAKLDAAFASIEQAIAAAEQNAENAKQLFQSYLSDVFERGGKGWVEKTLNHVCVVERGSSPRPIQKYFTDDIDGVNWIKIGDTEEGGKYVYKTNQKITREGALKSRHVKSGDFILTNSMSYGRPYIMRTEGYIHDGWFVLRLNEKLDAEYFFYLLSSPFVQKQFRELAAGAVVKNISGDLVKRTKLPIPSYAKQQKLAQDFLRLEDESEKLRSLYERKENLERELKQSLLHQAFNGQLVGA